jgi:large subunit ribosomal protein L47
VGEGEDARVAVQRLATSLSSSAVRLAMLSALRVRSAVLSRQATVSARAYATVEQALPVAAVSDAVSSSTPKDDATVPTTGKGGAPGALRPHLNTEVNPNHGLYAFFRQVEQDTGEKHYETIEPGVPSITDSGEFFCPLPISHVV